MLPKVEKKEQGRRKEGSEEEKWKGRVTRSILLRCRLVAESILPVQGLLRNLLESRLLS